MTRLLSDERGFTLFEGVIAAILLAMAAALIFEGWASYSAAAAQQCQARVLTMSKAEQQWENSKKARNPDKGLCNDINRRVGEYNAACAKYGTLPTLSCE
jgi:type II secretory pathway pseudopilin PulG